MTNGFKISHSELLELLPQQRPFRFVDEIIEVSANHAVGKYTFRENEFFYPGHFPGNPVTPGVILLEAMAQVGVVVLGLYLKSLEGSLEELKKYTTLFADGSVEFYEKVLPGDTVVTRAEKHFWRMNKLKSKTQMFRGETLVASATVSGMGVKNG